MHLMHSMMELISCSDNIFAYYSYLESQGHIFAILAWSTVKYILFNQDNLIVAWQLQYKFMPMFGIQ
jgi:hypothetical protein